MNHNSSIGCIVTECKHHYKEDNYCTLNTIQIVKHDQEAKVVETTDCGSFEKEH